MVPGNKVKVPANRFRDIEDILITVRDWRKEDGFAHLDKIEKNLLELIVVANSCIFEGTTDYLKLFQKVKALARKPHRDPHKQPDPTRQQARDLYQGNCQRH